MVVLGGKNCCLTDTYRLVELTDTQENMLGIITNLFDLSAEEIGQMYLSRWEVELFFKPLFSYILLPTLTASELWEIRIRWKSIESK